MSAVIVNLQPNVKRGKLRDNVWSIIYDKASREFLWTLTVPMKAQFFTGTASSMLDAKQAVNSILEQFK